jgi:hypothetical protein
MAVAVSNGAMPVRGVDRTAMRRVLADSGFPHALDSIAQAVSVELVSDVGRSVDARLGEMADQTEHVVLDALVRFAREHGWKATS